MGESKKRLGSILMGGAFIIASLLMISLFIKPAISESQKLRAEKNSKEKILTDRQAAVNQVEGLVVEYQGGQKMEEVLETVLPDGENIPESIAQIQGLTEINSLILKSIAIETEEKKIIPSQKVSVKKNSREIKADFNLIGAYEDFKNFIEDVENNIRLMDVVSVNIKTEKEASRILNFNVLINIYYQ